MGTRRGIVLLALALILWAQEGMPDEAAAQDPAWRIDLTGDVQSAAPSSVTIEDLEKLPLTEYNAFDPFKKQRINFTGVLLRDIVREYGAAGVDRVQVKAIDQYIADFIRDEWARIDILLATRMDGKPITIKQNGPVRIVLPDDTARDMGHDVFIAKWIWFVKSIQFIRTR